MGTTDWIKEELEELNDIHQYRRLTVLDETGAHARVDGKDYLNFSSNDYLGLSNHEDVLRASKLAISEYGSGSTSSRLVSGTLRIHQELEMKLAEYTGFEVTLLCGTGYLANLAVVTTLVGRSDVIFIDKLAHASLVDAAVLSRAEIKRFNHNDTEHLREMLVRERKPGQRFLIVTESVFSMDGDVAPVNDICELAEKYQAMLLVDEAHAVGVFGGGVINMHGLWGKVTALTFGCGKALGSYGGVVCCSNELRELLVNKARTFIYNTALPPASVAASIAALNVLVQEPKLGERLLEKAEVFRVNLKEAGLDTSSSSSNIVPVLVGDNEQTLSFASALLELGIRCVAIRPPTVPKGTARLRFSLSQEHKKDELIWAAEKIIGTAKQLGVC